MDLTMVNIRKLYKYLKAEHAEAMLEHGTIRIGTLHFYRAIELGPAIGDSLEGRSETAHAIDKAVDVSKPDNRSWVVDKVFNLGDATNVSVEGLTLTVAEEHPDCYIYCASHGYSSAALRAFHADVCVAIDKPIEFMASVFVALRDDRLVQRATLRPCDYSGRARAHQMARVSPALLKDPQYSYQKEVRLLMEPVTTPIEPFVTSIPGLQQFCSMRK